MPPPCPRWLVLVRWSREYCCRPGVILTGALACCHPLVVLASGILRWWRYNPRMDAYCLVYGALALGSACWLRRIAPHGWLWRIHGVLSALGFLALLRPNLL